MLSRGLVLGLLVAWPAVGLAQAVETFHGVVLEQGTLRPVAGAEVLLLAFDSPGIRLDGEESDVLAVTFSDSAGSFRVEVPAGVYRARLQARGGGFTSPVSPLLTPGDGESIELLLPWVHLGRVVSCGESPGSILVGTVSESESGIPLPGAEVSLRSPLDPGNVRDVSVDPDGGYVVCGLPAGDALEVYATFAGRMGDLTTLVAPDGATVIHDMAIVLGEWTEGVAPPSIADWEPVTTPGRSSAELGVLVGRVSDASTGAPIEGMAVELLAEGAGATRRTATAADGSFRMQTRGEGADRVRLVHVAYGEHTVPLEVPSEGGRLSLELEPTPVVLDGVSVAGTPSSAVGRREPYRRNVVFGRELALAELRGGSVREFLRGHPGVLVASNGRIQLRQAFQSLNRSPEAPLVILDGIRAGAGHLSMPLSEVQSIEILEPREAIFRYGLSASGGAIEIFTRGKGPFRDDVARDCPACG